MQLSTPFDVKLTTNPALVNDAMAKEGVLLFQMVTNRLQLHEPVRQSGDPLYASILQRIRDKRTTKEDIKHLSSRLFYSLPAHEQQDFAASLHIFPTHSLIDDHNKRYILGLGKPCRLVLPKMKKYCPSCIRDYKWLLVGEGLKIQITRNLSYKLGIANGSVGTIIDSVFHCDDSTDPTFLVVKFPSFRGIPLTGTRNSVPIPWSTEKQYCPHLKEYVTVQFLPAINYQAVTYFKIQGTTLDKCVVYLTNQGLYSSQAYVGLTRATSLKTVAIICHHPLEKIFKPMD